MGNNREVRKLCSLKTLVVLALVAIMVGCEIPVDTKNVGGGWVDPPSNLVLTAPTTGLYGMETSTWSVSWYGGEAPYTVAWDWGGGGTNVPAAPGFSPVTQDVTWVDFAAPMDFTVTVTVTDALGFSNSASVTVSIGHGHDPLPVITDMTVAENILTVTVSAGGGNDVTVSISGYQGMTSDTPSKTTDANGVTTFNFTADDMLVGANSTVDVTATDWSGGVATATSPAIVIPGFMPAVDTLYAIPMASSAAVDEPVTILVYTGATGAFQFMLNVGLVVPSDATYESSTFNIGAIGGNTDDADGVWSDITVNGGFILGPDVLIMPGANPEDSLGTDLRFDFNISPLGGTDQPSVEGALFNAAFSFSSAGTKTITFQAVNGVNRTYYSDLASRTDTFWGNYVDGYVDVS